MDQIDRYVLGLAVLEGDRDARKILADLLEEQGDRGLAQWARSSQGKPHRRLDVAIMLLPSQLAMRLACECIAVARYNDYRGQPLPAAHDCSAIVVRWLDKHLDDMDVLHQCRRQYEDELRNMWDAPGGRYEQTKALKTNNSLCEELIAGIEHAIRESTARLAGDGRVTAHWGRMTNQSAREMARLTRGWIPATPVLGSESLADVRWQVFRTIALFQDLISPQQSD